MLCMCVCVCVFVWCIRRETPSAIGHLDITWTRGHVVLEAMGGRGGEGKSGVG